MSTKIQCEQCGCDMKCVHTTKVTNMRKKKFRKRRFECTNLACKHQIAIYADGERDLEWEPQEAENEAKQFNDDINQN